MVSMESVTRGHATISPGLELARLADLPEDVLAEGREVAEKLAALHTRQQKESESGKISARRRVLLRVWIPNNKLGWELI